MGGVLINYDLAPELDALAALYTRPQDARNRLTQLWAPDDLHTGRVSARDIFQRMISAFGTTASYEAFLEARTLGCGPPIDGIEPIVDSLRQQYRLALLSNTNEAHWDRVRVQSGQLLNKLGPHFLSFELGMAKPDPAIYAHVTQSLALTPGQCLFIDDSAEYVEGARLAGLNAIEFANSTQLVHELAAYGIDARANG